MEEYARSCVKDEIVDFTKNGKCSQCGQCSGNLLPLTEKEVKRIHRYIKENGIKECRTIIPLSIPALDMTCPFCDTAKPDKKCKIYPVRPEICKAFVCNKEPLEMMTKELWENERMTVDMREEFYGG